MNDLLIIGAGLVALAAASNKAKPAITPTIANPANPAYNALENIPTNAAQIINGAKTPDPFANLFNVTPLTSEQYASYVYPAPAPWGYFWMWSISGQPILAPNSMQGSIS
jgi:hypothetical protein